MNLLASFGTRTIIAFGMISCILSIKWFSSVPMKSSLAILALVLCSVGAALRCKSVSFQKDTALNCLDSICMVTLAAMLLQSLDSLPSWELHRQVHQICKNIFLERTLYCWWNLDREILCLQYSSVLFILHSAGIILSLGISLFSALDFPLS